MRQLPNDFIPEKTFGVEINACAEVAATTVAMDNGFTFTAPVAGTCQAGDTFGGMWLYSHTAGAAELGAVVTTNEIFQFVVGRPIRFIADITFQLLATELNWFCGCQNAMLTAPTITAGGGMKATGDHFGFYTPDSSSAVFATPASIFCVSMHNGTAQITELTAANSLDGQAYVVAIGTQHEFRAEWIPTGSEPGVGGIAPTIFEAEIHFYIDGVLVAVHRQNGANRITAANTTLMNFGIYSENITDIITYEIRQLKCRQLRTPAAGA
jgi:hypothetical protein